MLPKLFIDAKPATAVTVESIAALVRYLRDDERKHYCQLYGLKPDDLQPVDEEHIYYHVDAVMRWLTEAPFEPRLTLRGYAAMAAVIVLFVFGPELHQLLTGIMLTRP